MGEQACDLAACDLAACANLVFSSLVPVVLTCNFQNSQSVLVPMHLDDTVLKQQLKIVQIFNYTRVAALDASYGLYLQPT